MSHLPDYSKNPQAYYAVLKTLTREQLRQEWEEITARDFDWFLCCVPPARLNSSAFVIGECATHGDRGPIHDVCVCITVGTEKRYYKRPMYLIDWGKENFTEEICQQFNSKVEEAPETYYEDLDEEPSVYYQEFDEYTDADPGL